MTDTTTRARFDVYQDAAGKWRWRKWISSDKVADSGQGYVDKADAWKRAGEEMREGDVRRLVIDEDPAA